MESLHFPRFAEMRKATARSPVVIEKYDSSKLEERFQQEFLSTITALEKQIERVKLENQRLEESLVCDRMDIEERKARIEDRTIGLVSFSTLIRFYSRFLDTREEDAKVKMSDPIDDLDLVTEYVEKLEAAAAEMEDIARDELGPELERMIFDEEVVVTHIESWNAFRRNSITLKRASFPLIRAALKGRKHVVREEVVEDDAAPLGFPAAAGYQKRIDNGPYAKLKKRQDALREKEASLRMAEEKRNAYLIEETARWRAKANHLSSLKQQMEEVAALVCSVEQEEKAVDAIKTEEMLNDWEEGCEKEKIRGVRRIKARIEHNKAQIEEMNKKISDMNVMSRKKEKLFKKKRAKLDALVKEIDRMEAGREDKEREISLLEQRLLLTEMLLNQQLKEAQSMSGYVLPPKVFEMKNGLSPRVDEMRKVIELVGAAPVDQ